MTILDTLIANATSDKALLAMLLGQTGAEVLEADNPAFCQAPTVDSNGVWTLAQDTANDGAEFVGVYKLPSAAVESCVQTVTVVAHSNPASPKKPARYLPKDADPVTGWVELASVATLDEKVFNKLEIRSASAFEIAVLVSDCYERCPSPTPELTYWYQAENLTFVPAGSIQYHAPTFSTYQELTSAKIHKVTLPEARCISGIRVRMFGYTAGAGANTGLRIRPVGRDWGQTAQVVSSGGSWREIDVYFGPYGDDGYIISEFEIETMNSDGGNYMLLDRFIIWGEY